MGSVDEGSGELSISFYTATDLQAEPAIAQELMDLVNLGFATHVNFHRDEPRFREVNEVSKMLGAEGLMAAGRINGSIGVCAALIPWRPAPGGIVDQAFMRDRPDDYKLTEQGLSYEVKTVITDKRSVLASRRGLASALVSALVAKSNHRHPGQDVLLWVQAAEEQAGPYWRRRGYEQVGPVERKPKGFWSSPIPFDFLTLVKRVGPALAA